MRERVRKVLGLFGGRRGRGNWDRGRGRGRINEELGGLELEEPIAETALFPLREILFGDGIVIEISGDDGFGFGEGVEPWEDEFGRDAVVEFEVKFFADGVGKTSDFADASGVHNIHDL